MDWDSEFTHPVHRGGGSPARPIGDQALVSTRNEITAPDFGLFRDVLNRHYYPARVEPLDRAPYMHAPRLSAVHLTRMTIGYVRFGTPASVDPGDLTGYHVNVPLSGTVVSQCGSQHAIATPETAAVFSPQRRTYLPHWEGDAAQLCIKFDRHQVEQELADMIGRPIGRPIDFRLQFPIGTGAGRRWTTLLSSLLTFLDEADGTTLAAAMHLELLQRSLISGLLLCQAHSYSDTLAQGGESRLLPRALHRVVAAVEAAPERPYTVAELAELAGMSERALQYAFQEHLGLSPRKLLQQIRLDRAREDLLAKNGSVSDIAYHWGYTNLGRFARAYHDRFGEFPSDTLTDRRRGAVRSDAR